MARYSWILTNSLFSLGKLKVCYIIYFTTMLQYVKLALEKKTEK